MVQHQLLGSGITATNITFSGVDTAFGFFNGMNSNIGLDSGLILTNGRAKDAVGPNNTPGKSFTWPNCHSYTDPDLASIANANVTSVAKVEFDFIPNSDSIKFTYVFGSEEYPEYVNSYNDAFGFFLSGPGISGPYTNNAENIALIPGTNNAPVSIDSVNCTVHSAYYVCNWPATTGFPCNVGCPTSSSLPSTTVQYDGFTVPLIAVAAVQCGQQYHIKLAVCNAGDCALESGVFFEAGSFTTNGAFVSSVINYNNNYYPGDTILYRGSCGSASLYIERPNALNPDTVLIDTSGTASPGIDYNPLPDTVILPAGVMGDTLHIHAYPSSRTGFQTIIARLIQHQCGTSDTQKVTIYIGNPPPITIAEPPATACFGGDVPLTPNVSGGVGVGNYTYGWNNGSTYATDTVRNITSDTLFVVKVKDQCGDSASDTVYVNLDAPFTLGITHDTTLNCPHDTLSISVYVSGGKPGYSYLWNNAETTSSIRPVTLTAQQYKVKVTDTCGFSAEDSMTVTINTTPLVLNTHDTTIQCQGFVHPYVIATGGGGVYHYNWSTGSTTSTILATALRDTNYIVTVSCACGNQSKIDTVKVTVVPVTFHVTITKDTSICYGQNLKLGVSGGNTYFWNTGSTSDSIPASSTTTKTYSVSVYIGNCIKDTNVTVTVNPLPVVTITPANQTICFGDSITLTASGGNIYAWSNGNTASSVKVSPPDTTTYKVIVSNGCIDSNSTKVFVKIPLVSACCDTTIKLGTSVTLNASPGATSYAWTPSTALSCTSCASPIANPAVTTTYTVTIMDTDGCPVEKVLTVTVENPCPDFEVPTVFTPNGDGINDNLVINVLNTFSYNINIFDRWGKQVFSSGSASEYWNGRINNSGAIVPDGVYFYVIKASCNSKDFSKKGFVEVLGEK